jgi:ABC-type amino acid transport substrate-binding protein
MQNSDPSRRIISHRRRSISLALAALALPCTQARADWSQIQAGGVLKVAVYKDFAPFSEVVRGVPQGLDVDLAQALAQRLGLKLSLLPFDAGEEMGDDLRNMVWKGHYLGYGPAHVLMHAPIDRVYMQRQDKVLFFGEYYRETLALLYDRQVMSEPQSAENLRGVTIGGETGTIAAAALLSVLSGQLAPDVRLYGQTGEAVEHLLKGEAQAVYATRASLEAALSRLGGSTTRYGYSSINLQNLAPQGWVVGMAVKAEEREMAKALEAALRGLESDGSLQAIYARQGVTLQR